MLHSPLKLRCFFNSAEEKGLIALSARVKPTHGGKKKTPIQRSIERLESYIDKLKEYTAKLHICGDRNSYSKTDHDATFMRLKEDAMLNGQLKPAYNLQHAVDAQYITWLQVCARPTDVSPLVPFLKDMESHLAFQDPERKDRTVPDGFENGINFEDPKQLRSGWFLNGITFR